MTWKTSPEVLVVGAGPVGLVAACELARRNVSVRLIDKLLQPTNQSRAIAVHARSLDMFHRMGIADELITTGIKAIAMQLYSGHSKLFRVPLGDVDSMFPFTLNTAQTETERILHAHLQSFGVTVERGVELMDLTQDGEAVHLTVRNLDGTTEEFSTSWVIGADGAHSTVRRLVGTKLQGCFEGERLLLGDVDVEHSLDVNSMHTFFSPGGAVVVLPMRDGRMRVLAELHDPPGTPVNPNPTQDALQAAVDERVGGIRVLRSHWLTSFEIRHAMVPAYRFGRVFLAGDAAHIHSPAGGQGMNTGLQDAYNLAWKLAAVVHGQAGQTLLDSYQAERLPVAKAVITFTDRLTKIGTLSGAPSRIRNGMLRIASRVPAARRFMANTAAEVTVAYRKSPLAVRRHPKHAEVAPGDHLPHVSDAALRSHLFADSTGHTVVTVASGGIPAAGDDGHRQVLVTTDDAPVARYDTVVADANGVLAQRLGLQRGGRIVIRPDGYLGAVARLDDTSAVTDYFAAVRS